MITKADIVSGALQHLATEGLLLQPMADDQRTAVQHLDDMTATYAASGLDTGYIQPEQYGTATPTDDSGVDVGLVGPLKIMLAGYIASQYGKQIDPGKLSWAERQLSAQLVNVQGSKYPVTLPIGSGNYDQSTFGENFYRGGLPR
ncbi:MAG TPA: packaged DNA stabilization gp4 family protein [Methylotenera sp.]|nr:packaged DNA stabilization gp4 family protein [Methylotenera sp.]